MPDGMRIRKDRKRKETRYDDIINLPHHRSKTHPHMALIDRAAQFAPFAALTGYGDAIDETARLTDGRPELSEQQLAELNERLLQIMAKPDTAVCITYFVPDERKAGGRYEQTEGTIKKIDETAKAIVMDGGERISIENIVELSE